CTWTTRRRAGTPTPIANSHRKCSWLHPVARRSCMRSTSSSPPASCLRPCAARAGSWRTNGSSCPMRNDPRHAYEAGAKTAVTNRELEATALFKAARKLEACVQGWGREGNNALLDEALRYNLRLWTLFQC